MSNRNTHSNISEKENSPTHESHTIKRGISQDETNRTHHSFDDTTGSEDEYNRRERLRRMWNNVAADSEE